MTYRIVAPYRPFKPETPHHVAYAAAFDWIEAIGMLADSVTRACGVPTVVLSADNAPLAGLTVPCLRYPTVERRLMLWYLEIAARYLASPAFDCNTVMLDSDQLVYGPLGRWFTTEAELGILVRLSAKPLPFPILNGVQFWPLRGKATLAAFYARALDVARTLPESDIAWGADSEALRVLLEPLDLGQSSRAGLTVDLIDSRRVLQAFSRTQIAHLHAGRFTAPPASVLDFRGFRKPYMRAVYEATFAHAGAS